MHYAFTWINKLISYFRNDSGSDQSPSSSRAPSRAKSRVDSAAERFSRRMSYVPPKSRKKSINKSAAQKKQSDSQNLKTDDDKNKNMSALSRRSVKNFDEKKYRSNSHLTPVDW